MATAHPWPWQWTAICPSSCATSCFLGWCPERNTIACQCWSIWKSARGKWRLPFFLSKQWCTRRRITQSTAAAIRSISWRAFRGAWEVPSGACKCPLAGFRDGMRWSSVAQVYSTKSVWSIKSIIGSFGGCRCKEIQVQFVTSIDITLHACPLVNIIYFLLMGEVQIRLSRDPFFNYWALSRVRGANLDGVEVILVPMLG